ncbi:septal ring lytic transglycosylase RlpA family protein [Crenobacter cavernae]|uniref:Endolytic peptidoglycan transglycosylase RlpA n=1 Tax=Crenobacter cavernae TaxID=2290923 RepID=A0ABY0FDW2_9NEIS|nr:septal ring lytic transglycosylase RlpA family protein [Crenobacter cavernae]RXZ44422.1 septal ring lytic transglycosylase RlpA family protein [Crenobacter cavernae]
MQPVFRWLGLVLVSIVLVACSTVKPASASNQSSTKSPKKVVAKRGAYFQNDGPADHIPANLDLVPDAVPRDEPLIKSANRPYSALGMSFTPVSDARPYRAAGRASWYGKQFHGRKTSSGERYDMFAMTAAHPTLPIPSYARVTNPRNGKSVVVRINDRGPFHKGRIMDLSYAAAHRLGYVGSGSTKVVVERVWPSGNGDGVDTRPTRLQEAKAQPVFLQLGSYNKLATAEAKLTQMQGKLDTPMERKLRIVNQEGAYRVRLGPFDNANAANAAASAIKVNPVLAL